MHVQRDDVAKAEQADADDVRPLRTLWTVAERTDQDDEEQAKVQLSGIAVSHAPLAEIDGANITLRNTSKTSGPAPRARKLNASLSTSAVAEETS